MLQVNLNIVSYLLEELVLQGNATRHVACPILGYVHG